MSWAKIKKAINSTVGTDEFKPIDKIVLETFDSIVKGLKNSTIVPKQADGLSFNKYVHFVDITGNFSNGKKFRIFVNFIGEERESNIWNFQNFEQLFIKSVPPSRRMIVNGVFDADAYQIVAIQHNGEYISLVTNDDKVLFNNVDFNVLDNNIFGSSQKIF